MQTPHPENTTPTTESKKKYPENKEAVRLRVAKWRAANKARVTELAREHNRNHRKKNPEHERARQAVNNAVRRGKLDPEPCFVCGNSVSEAHHHDYSQPLEVTWFCREHHLAVHGGRLE